MRRVTVSLAVAACWVLCLLAPAGAEAEDFLPDNGKIAFSSHSSIYTSEPDGSNLKQLTNNTSGAWQPIWSPDGTEIAFWQEGRRGEDGFLRHRLLVMNADGSDLRDLHARSTYTVQSTWSPDGTKLAFSSGGSMPHTGDIYMMDPDGSNQINLTESPKRDELSPDFSPDGSQMCFSSYKTGALKPAPGIYVMDTDGTDSTLLVKDELDAGGVCDWSPDGTKIAFEATYYPDAEAEEYQKAVDKALAEGDLQKAQEIVNKLRDVRNNKEVYVINADGSGKTKLTRNSAADIYPRWSPDGTKITFVSDRDGDFDIYTMEADGSDIAQVTKNSRNDESSPDWQPLPGTTPPKDTDGSDGAQDTKKPAVEDVDRDRPECTTVIVKPGDSLWSMSEESLGPEASPQQVYDHTYQMYALNRKLIGSDPDLIFVGQRLSLPPPR